jgi:hypothetical protein
MGETPLSVKRNFTIYREGNARRYGSFLTCKARAVTSLKKHKSRTIRRHAQALT